VNYVTKVAAKSTDKKASEIGILIVKVMRYRIHAANAAKGCRIKNGWHTSPLQNSQKLSFRLKGEILTG